MVMNVRCDTNEEICAVLKKIEHDRPNARWRNGVRPTCYGHDLEKGCIAIDGDTLYYSSYLEPEDTVIKASHFLHRKKVPYGKPILEYYIFGGVKRVIYNPPATIVFFVDGDKKVAKAEDEFNWETGLAICLLKKAMSAKQYNRMQPYLFAEEPKAKHGKVKWIPLWDVMVRQAYPNGEWEKIKKVWKMK